MAASTENPIAARVRVLSAAFNKIAAQQEMLMSFIKGQRSITQEIDSIPGRRIFYGYVGSSSFTSAQAGLRGEAITFQVSQDGPFVMTHFPSVSWAPNAPSNATNFGQWSAVGSWPLPTQQNTDQDRIDISYEFVDGGSQRNFQNSAVGQVLSRPDNLIPLPVPTLFAPNATIQFYPTFNSIFFAGPSTATTGGLLVVSLSGYKIANL